MTTGSAYLRKRKSALKFLIRTPKRRFGQDRFHLLRVEIKKLKAALYRMEFLLPEFDRKKFYKPFRKLFAQAGRVREFQIEKDLLKSYGQPESIPEYMKYLDKNIQKERTRFFQLRSLRLNSKIQKRLKGLGKQIREVKNLDPFPYFKSMTEEIKLLLSSGTLEVESAHLLRKKLKNLKYNLESILGEKFALQHPEQENLVNLLGTWHDLVTVHQTIQNELQIAPLHEEEKNSLRKINQKIKADSKRIFEEINQKIPLFDDFILPPNLKKRGLKNSIPSS